MSNEQKIKRAFDLLRTIPVVDIHVDTMHEVRLLLADVHKGLRGQEGAPVKKGGGEK